MSDIVDGQGSSSFVLLYQCGPPYQWIWLILCPSINILNQLFSNFHSLGYGTFGNLQQAGPVVINLLECKSPYSSVNLPNLQQAGPILTFLSVVFSFINLQASESSSEEPHGFFMRRLEFNADKRENSKVFIKLNEREIQEFIQGM